VNEPVLICSELLTIPVGNIVGAKDADVAKDADCGVNVIDVAADAVVAKDAVSGVNVIDVAADAVVANDDERTLVANKIPVNDPLNEPTEPVDTFTIARTNILDCDGGATKNDKFVPVNV
jgi:hypothetical protein